MQDTEKILHIRTENTQYSNYTPHFVNEMAIFAWPNLFIAFYCTLPKNINITAKFPLGHTKKSRCPRQRGQRERRERRFALAVKASECWRFMKYRKPAFPGIRAKEKRAS
ncbi:MAG: hypothetical protein V8Q30_13380 [Acutalibacteraceae bacterium]